MGLSNGAAAQRMRLFPPGKGGEAKVDHGDKGKGILIHLLVDREGMPLSATMTAANGSEREQVPVLIESVDVRTGKRGRPPKGGEAHRHRQRLCLA